MRAGTLDYDRSTARYNVIDGAGQVIVDGLHCGDVFDVYEAELYPGNTTRQEEADRAQRWVSARIELDESDTWFLLVNGETTLHEEEAGDRKLQGVVVRV